MRSCFSLKAWFFLILPTVLSYGILAKSVTLTGWIRAREWSWRFWCIERGVHAPDLSDESRLVEFGLLKTSRDLFNLLRLIFCFKLINGMGPSSFLQFFNPSKVNELMYLHSTSRTNAFFNSVFVSFPRLWNELPNSVRSSPSLALFKNFCKDH